MSRKVLTLSERVEAIKLHDDGKSSRDVAQIMGIERTQIQQIIKGKVKFLTIMKAMSATIGREKF